MDKEGEKKMLQGDEKKHEPKRERNLQEKKGYTNTREKEVRRIEKEVMDGSERKRRGSDRRRMSSRKKKDIQRVLRVKAEKTGKKKMREKKGCRKTGEPNVTRRRRRKRGPKPEDGTQ